MDIKWPEVPKRMGPTHEERKAARVAAHQALRYRTALGLWYARMAAAARAGEQFDEPRPQPEDQP
jgi:hypothetical protein